MNSASRVCGQGFGVEGLDSKEGVRSGERAKDKTIYQLDKTISDSKEGVRSGERANVAQKPGHE